MATSGRIGPGVQVRVDGKGEHDLMEIKWTVTKTKTPQPVIGKDVADRYTSGQKTVEWSGTAVSRSDGTFAIPWDNLCATDKTLPLVFATSGRTERLSGVAVDSVDNNYDRESGKWEKAMSGKAFDHSYE